MQNMPNAQAMEGVTTPEVTTPLKRYSAPNVAMGIFEQALEIAQSRLDFYNTRQELLTGTDEASLAYQKEVNTDGSVNITSDGGGLEYVLALINSPELQKEQSLKAIRKGNSTFINQWEFVKAKITTLKRRWKEDEFQALQKSRYLFDIKKIVTKAEDSNVGFNVHKDTAHISSDGIDFDAIEVLLMSSEPYLMLQQKLKEAEERAKQEQLLQQERKRWETKSVNEIVEWINTGTQPPVAQGDKKKKKKRDKKNTPSHSDQESKSTRANSVPAAPPADTSTQMSSPPSKDMKESASTDSLLVPVTSNLTVEKRTETVETISAPTAQEDAETFIEDVGPTQYPSINNPKTRRLLEKEKGMKVKEGAQNAAVSDDTKPQLKLDVNYIDTLTDVLKVVSHPPTWTQSLKAICEVIKQWGGSYREDLGDGSTAEFWIGNTRFITDKTHNSGLMYKAQMKFMRKGLIRAGITLEYLSQLKVDIQK
jgi:hypothetical protein